MWLCKEVLTIFQGILYFFAAGECRGIGGIFFDDLDTPDQESCFQFVSVSMFCSNSIFIVNIILPMSTFDFSLYFRNVPIVLFLVTFLLFIRTKTKAIHMLIVNGSYYVEEGINKIIYFYLKFPYITI